MLALGAFGIQTKHIYLDKQSGKDFVRPQYQKLMRRIKGGDVIVIPAIDRLGRNYAEITEQWRFITKERRADVVVLDMPLLDTRAKDRDLTGRFVADLVLQILSYVAETERINIKNRQAQGIAAARMRGVRFGAPPKPIPPTFDEIRQRFYHGDLSLNAAARTLGVSPHTVRNWMEKTKRER